MVIIGTDKDDLFEITRGPGTTTIKVYRIKKGDVTVPYKERVIQSNETHEVWLYGLDDDDQFIVNGEGAKPVYIRIIGGQNNDVYTIENGRKVKIHEHKTKPNTFVKTSGAKVRKSDIYEINTYDYERRITRSNNIIPVLGGNPDDGILFGLTNTYTISGFKENPFHQRHSIGAQYYLATSGFQLNYKGEFASVFGTWNLTLDGRITTDNFTRNFFGFGNNTENIDDQEDVDFDFNRVRTANREGHIGVVKYGEYGGSFEFKTGIENIQVENTPNRFTTNFFANDPEVFEAKTFATSQFKYQFQNFDNQANPARGMVFLLGSGVTTNLEDTERTFGFVHPKLAFYNALTSDQKLVLKTTAQGQFNIGRQYEFYQAAVLGDNAGLRGFRTERFSGQSAFAASGDLRYSFKKLKTLLLPIQLGIYGGYDIGRVWIKDESSNIWHDSMGGGLFINAIDALSGEIGIFNSDDGIRFSFRLGVAF